MQDYFKTVLSNGVVFILLFLFASSIPAKASTLVVTSTADSGPGSLRNAVSLAATGDTVSFALVTNGTPIVLTTGQISIDSGITILGNGADSTIIDGNHASCAFYIPTHVPNDTIRIQSLKIQNGYNTNGAGGIALYPLTTADGFILNLSYLEITACISNCACDGNGGAVGIRSGNIDHCYLHHNRELSGFIGAGGVTIIYHPVSITNTTIAYCSGTSSGAVSNGGGSLVNCTIYADTALSATQGIGGLSLRGQMINCTVSGCYGSAAGGIGHSGLPFDSIVNSIIYGNDAGDTAARDVLIVIDDFFGNGLDNATYKKSIVGVCKYVTNTTGSCPAWFSTADPLFGNYGMNGGFAPTLPIQSGSAARNSADTAFAPATDQRDYARSGQADIGAYEYQCGVIAVTLASFAPDTICQSASPIQLPAGNPSPGIFSGTGVTNNTSFDPATAGVGTHTITYTYTDSYGCFNNDSTSITVELCSGINILENAGDLQVYPNPFRSTIYLDRSKQLSTISQLFVQDITGKLLRSVTITEPKQAIDLSALPSGIYILKAMDEGHSYTTKLVKE